MDACLLHSQTYQGHNQTMHRTFYLKYFSLKNLKDRAKEKETVVNMKRYDYDREKYCDKFVETGKRERKKKPLNIKR